MASRPFQFWEKNSFAFSWACSQVRDIFSQSPAREGTFIYALSADETSTAFAALRNTITALFFCRFKCPCPPQRQRYFHGNADRAYNTLHFASKVVCQPCFVGVCSHTSSKTQNKRLQSAVKITAGLTAYFVSALPFTLLFPWMISIKKYACCRLKYKRKNDKQGGHSPWKLYEYRPKIAAGSDEMKQFIEMCFDPLSEKLKQTLLP